MANSFGTDIIISSRGPEESCSELFNHGSPYLLAGGQLFEPAA